MTSGSRIIEKGHGSTFELHHTLLSCKTVNRITLPTYVLKFRFLGPTVPELYKKGVAVLLNCTTQPQGTLRNPENH